MSKYLVIVESPAKSKTIEKYLGSDFDVTSSKGHIRDLSISGYGGFGVDIENNFTPSYRILKDKATLVKELKKEVKKYDKIYLATDPDREGEAISWHLYEALDLKDKAYERIVFHEITKKAVLAALEQGRNLDLNLVKSQESRRIVDRIIGFSLSTLLQKKIGSKSAGRVQSVALKLIVDREAEINSFIPVEYWDVFIEFTKGKKVLKAELNSYLGEKVSPKSFEDIALITSRLSDDYSVVDISTKNRHKAPRPAFITSTLQQEASSKFNYSAKKTNNIAQQLYEGIELEQERVGLITYMRTDSTRLSLDFVNEAKNYIYNNFGKDYYGSYKEEKPKANIQDAHEAIRPVNITYTPEKVKSFLTNDQYKLYSLIYLRALGSLMANAIINEEKVTINNEGYYFIAKGEKVVFDGYLKIYPKKEQETFKSLPLLKVDERLENVKFLPEQKFTNPPLRYSEARLIKKMEELGIGRPSTYALTIETLKLRNYVAQEQKMFFPTKQGILTSEKLDEFFPAIINVQYTAQMENDLDAIAEGKMIWHEELKSFYDEFKPLLDNANENMEKIYPVFLEELCPECGAPLVIRNGRYGEFVACSAFPKCRYIKKEEKDEPKSTGIKCPNCELGEIVERISKKGRQKGKTFYACNQFPKCKTVYNDLSEVENK